jgi:hypothetical protein
MSLLSALTLILVGGYIAVDLLLAVRNSLQLACDGGRSADRPWYHLALLRRPRIAGIKKKPPGRSPCGFFRNCRPHTPVPLHFVDKIEAASLTKWK